MHPEQKTSIGVSKDGFTLTGNQSDYFGTILWAVLAFVILCGLALLRWGPEKFKGIFKGKSSNGNGNGVKKAVAEVEDSQEKIEVHMTKLAENQITMQQNQALMQKDIDFIKNEIAEVKGDQKEIKVEQGNTRQVAREQFQNISNSVTTMTQEILKALITARSA